MEDRITYLESGIECLESLITFRLRQILANDGSSVATLDVPVEVLDYFKDIMAGSKPFKAEEVFGQQECYCVLVALAPHLSVDFFDKIISREYPAAGDFPAFGGVRGKYNRGLIPTGDTILFLLAGSNLEERLRVITLFKESHFFHRRGILSLGETSNGEPITSGKIILSQDIVQLTMEGNLSLPKFGKDFPAQRISTNLDLETLILDENTYRQIFEIENWIKHGEVLLKDPKLGKHIKRGYRALFHGPPGTGKTLTATILGKRNNKHVYRIDLSLVVSKYIGETEKNLAIMFNKAEHKDWILFFDEADALFGKRTNVKDAHDRYANQEIAYLLQRIENYDGLVVMATNMKKNIDEAFLRRFQSVIHFPMPNSEERIKIWEQALPSSLPLHTEVDITAIGKKYKISGASIINVIHYCSLQAKSRKNGTCQLQFQDFVTGIRREMAKDGRIMS